MTRNLKALGLTLIVGVALGAVAISTATAKTNGEYTAAKYPAHVVSAAESSSHLKALGGSVDITCTTEGATAVMAAASTSIEVTPFTAGCKTGTRAVTFTHNECKDKSFNLSDTNAEGVTTPDEWRFTTSLVCPAGKKVEVHIYNNESHASGSWCTLTMFPADNENLEGLTATVNTNTPTAPNDFTVEGSVTVRHEVHGTCSAGLTVKSNGTLEVTGLTVTGKDEVENPVSVDIG